jgi:hypothetical protein
MTGNGHDEGLMSRHGGPSLVAWNRSNGSQTDGEAYMRRYRHQLIHGLFCTRTLH